jgi:hypothetical protein
MDGATDEAAMQAEPSADLHRQISKFDMTNESNADRRRTKIAVEGQCDLHQKCARPESASKFGTYRMGDAIRAGRYLDLEENKLQMKRNLRLIRESLRDHSKGFMGRFERLLG